MQLVAADFAPILEAVTDNAPVVLAAAIGVSAITGLIGFALRKVRVR